MFGSKETIAILTKFTHSAADDHDDSKLFRYETNHDDDNDWSIGGE